MNSIENENQVCVFPNPFTSETTIKISSSVKIENAELKIFDILGNELKIVSGINSSEIKVERGKLTAGIYFYQIKNMENVTSGK